MRKDIDRIMKKMRVDALYAEGKASCDTTMYYLLNGTNIFGHYIKKCGKRAYVVHSPIEREEARKTGLRLINSNEYDIKQIFEKYRDKTKAHALVVRTILDDLKIKGTVAFYGNTQLGKGYCYVRQLLKFDKKIKVHYNIELDPIAVARETKDKEEIERIKKVRDGVVHAFNTMLKTVRQMRIKKNAIIKEKNKKLTVGDLKAMLRQELFMRNLICSRGLIVAQGRDAGIPHNSGRDRETVRIGKTIVFDIFPQELGGGYFFDFTRTICFGTASREIKELYRVVKDSQDFIFEKIRVGRKTVKIEKSLCEFFEKRGHPTFLSNRKTQVGYCHSLGHGLGLEVHESPLFGLLKTNTDRIKPGMVFTVEPGLYYPDKGHGIRLEDVVYVDHAGRVKNMTNYSRKLVIPM